MEKKKAAGEIRKSLIGAPSLGGVPCRRRPRRCKAVGPRIGGTSSHWDQKFRRENARLLRHICISKKKRGKIYMAEGDRRRNQIIEEKKKGFPIQPSNTVFDDLRQQPQRKKE